MIEAGQGHVPPSSFSITGKEEISTTYGEHRYVKQVNQHLILGAIGEGSFSRVFVAVDIDTGTYHAIKPIHLQKVAKASVGVAGIEREIALMRRFSHPNIVRLHEVIYVRQSRAVYLVLGYAGCGNLAALVKRGVAFSRASIRFIFRQVAEAVSYFHANRIVHQDLKPENILLREDGTVLISDFGTGHRFQSCARGFGTPA
jgi:serine/threonine protein kinase